MHLKNIISYSKQKQQKISKVEKLAERLRITNRILKINKNKVLEEDLLDK